MLLSRPYVTADVYNGVQRLFS